MQQILLCVCAKTDLPVGLIWHLTSKVMEQALGHAWAELGLVNAVLPLFSRSLTMNTLTGMIIPELGYRNQQADIGLDERSPKVL